MNATLWQHGYRSVLMDVFFGHDFVGAAKNPEGLASDFVSGAVVAIGRARELAELRDTDPDGYARLFGPRSVVSWEAADALASTEALCAWEQLSSGAAAIKTEAGQ